MIPQRDVRFLQQRAFQIYVNGGGQNEVKSMLIEAGGNNQEAEEYAQKFKEDFAFFNAESVRKEKKDAPLGLIVGAIMLFGGILMAAISYVFTEGIVVILYGFILAGAIIFFRALIAQNRKV
ncbi:hypothetical protein [Emticicia sp. C21]|uniref:hypothetical protein n=1 Tax=Emticicia sp. C21 TaxID=2302915 RepID=UPI000E34DA89|nr:hypothetical protein [Emticicia sp. C21]RFS14066.1 hypothetical protein D0T08_22715 [Emticicia sp. C21]